MKEISKEYAEALFMLALEKGEEVSTLEKLKEVLEGIENEPEYMQFLCSRSIAVKERLSAVENAFLGVLPEICLSFLCLLIEKGRIVLFPSCVKEYEKLLDAKMKVITARVISAIPLKEEEKQALKVKLENKYSSKVELQCEVDEQILGGSIIEIDGNVLDGSLRFRLQEIKEEIKK